MNEPFGPAGETRPDEAPDRGPEPPYSTHGGRVRLRVGPEEAGQRLDRFLASRFEWRSRTSVEGLIQTGKVELEGRSPRPSRKVHEGEVITVELPKARREVELEERGKGEIAVLYEDHWLLAVDKPAGIPVHPGGRLLNHTVITELTRRYAALDPEIVPKLCHRLDLETSGVLLLGKDDGVVAEVGRQLRERETHKEYRAIVHGVVAEDRFEVDAPIGRALASGINLKREVRPDGESARTSFEVERRFRDFTLLKVHLHTGRRHQIRVHLRHCDHPIVGDKLYGVDDRHFVAYQEGTLDERMREALRLPRQALHASRLTLEHPVRKQRLDLHSPFPADLGDFLQSLEPRPEHDGSGPQKG